MRVMGNMGRPYVIYVHFCSERATYGTKTSADFLLQRL